MNEILRRAILDAHLNEVDIAVRLEVDPKTVRRWLEGRLPYPRHRWALADLLDLNEIDLWPELRLNSSLSDELLAIYPHRSSIRRETWRSLFASAEHEISILDYSGLFLAEDAHILAARASVGVRVRVILSIDGSSDSEYGVQVLENAGIDVRLYSNAVLYNSIYRADNEFLVNHYAYGFSAEHGPVLHLRMSRTDDMTATYLRSFEDAWSCAVFLNSNR